MNSEERARYAQELEELSLWLDKAQSIRQRIKKSIEKPTIFSVNEVCMYPQDIDKKVVQDLQESSSTVWQNEFIDIDKQPCIVTTTRQCGQIEKLVKEAWLYYCAHRPSSK